MPSEPAHFEIFPHTGAPATKRALIKRALTVIGIATPVLLFAAYLALTSGTWFLIPDVITRIEPGMTCEESIGQFPEEWLIDNADINLLAGGHKK